MSGFQRFAVYYLPEDPDLAAFGASWLGWDVGGGTPCAQPEIEDIGRFTDTPRKYGFHGTLKPPFRLAPGLTADDLENDVEALAARSAPVRLDGLALSVLGRFLALVPVGDAQALTRLAFRCVTELDLYRAPPGEAELARRRKAGLTPRQEALLARWGYPYVGDEFRFHLTLTGSLGPGDLAAARAAIAMRLPALPAPFTIGSIALVGEDAAGLFHLVHRYALSG